MKAQIKIAIFLLFPAISLAQVPVDDDGQVIGQYEVESDAVLLSPAELEELVGPIALYPDDLLAIVLPASAYPLQIVEAARFLDAYETDSSLEPNENWDDAVVALINYPEVIELLNDDLDWTLRLGDAVVAQQTDVVAAVESFRDRAYAAGNLKSDEYQTVSENEGVIYIEPAKEDVIYVPYYEPARVVYYQPQPVYYYYPRPRPVYYYPYAANHHFAHGYFWGVTTAFTIGWSSHSLHTWHHSYHGHPYYGHNYWYHWYRRPSINVYNTYYTRNYRHSGNYHTRGDRWRPHERRREYVRREGYLRTDRNGDRPVVRRNRDAQPIAFRERDSRVTPRAEPSTRHNTTRRNSERQDAADRRDSPQRSSNQRNRRSEQQPSNVRRNSTERQDAADRRESERRGGSARARESERPEITFRQRETRRQEPTVRPSTTAPATRQRNYSPAARAQEPRRERPTAEPRNRERSSANVRPRESRVAPAPRQANRPAERQRRSEPRAQQRQQPARQQSNSRSNTRKSESRGERSERRSRR